MSARHLEPNDALDLDTICSEDSLRECHHSGASWDSSIGSSRSSAGYSSFSVAHGDADYAARSAAGGSIFTGSLSFMRSRRWDTTTSNQRKLRDRRMSLWQQGTPEADAQDTANVFRSPPTYRLRQRVCIKMALTSVFLGLLVLVVCLRVASRNSDPLDATIKVPALACKDYDFCRDESQVVAQIINMSVNPCDDFHEFVCGSWTRYRGELKAQDQQKTDMVMKPLLSRALSEMTKETPSVNGSSIKFDLANDVFFEQCMKTHSRERTSLGVARKLLAKFALGGWPYTSSHSHNANMSFRNVLQTASRIALNLGLATFASVRVFGTEKDGIFEVDDPTLLLRKDDLSGAKMSRSLLLHQELIADTLFYFAHTSRDIYTVQEDIQLVSLILGQSSRRSSERSFCTFAHETTLGKLSFLGLYIRRLLPNKANVSNNATVLLRNPLVGRTLEFAFRYLRPQHLLNYLGFRLLVHLSPFIFEIPNNIVKARMSQLTGVDKMVWLKAEVCLRLSEEALPALYLYDLYMTRPPVYWQQLENMLTVIKHSVLIGPRVPWKFSGEDTKSLLHIMRHLDFKTFLPQWLLNNTLLEAYNRRLLPNRKLDVFQMYSHVWRRTTHAMITRTHVDKLLADPGWRGSVFNPMPLYSFPENTLYIPMALFNTSLPATQDAFYLHAVEATWKLAYALAPIFELSSYWDNRTLSSYRKYEMCFRTRYEPYMTPGIKDSALHLAYADEISVLWAERLVRLLMSTSAASPLVEFSREQFFYIYTALSKCRKYGVSLQPLSAVMAKRRVNMPYMYSPRFRKAWSCRVNFRCK